MLRRLVMCLLPVLLVAGCAKATTAVPAATPDPRVGREVAFLDVTRSPGGPSDAKLLEWGYQVCKELQAGRIRSDETPTWAILRFKDEGPASSAVTVGMRANLLCPDWARG